ncbi:MAG: hypothetical protein IPI59_15640 [Sphingobacteriales bacterium]|jgi:hypothetical protein|nr:hypothetical protein [Sphingobacteriales bacterium]MCC7058001.1 hypothetical protein [Chitinophagales bacterium]MDA0199681.1 hypothetical protein [Bacteroidota bacterium]MBK6888563.1 hypothetical protein [Sphingobacteriales bacterium]MBK7528929.1 hypothetical protein [Sphingobacteriales bacterium]
MKETETNALNATTALTAKIKEWKKEFGEKNIRCIDVKVADGDIATCYVKIPGASSKTLDIYSRALQFYQQNKLLECGQFLLNSCWLGGDERCKGTDPIVYVSAAMAMTQLVTFYETEIKNA